MVTLVFPASYRPRVRARDVHRFAARVTSVCAAGWRVRLSTPVVASLPAYVVGQLVPGLVFHLCRAAAVLLSPTDAVITPTRGTSSTVSRRGRLLGVLAMFISVPRRVVVFSPVLVWWDEKRRGGMGVSDVGL